jgi:hypothetical protein
VCSSDLVSQNNLAPGFSFPVLTVIAISPAVRWTNSNRPHLDEKHLGEISK